MTTKRVNTMKTATDNSPVRPMVAGLLTSNGGNCCGQTSLLLPLEKFTRYVTSASLPCSATLHCLDEDSLLTHERLYVSEYFIIYVDHKIIDIIRPQQNILFSSF